MDGGTETLRHAAPPGAAASRWLHRYAVLTAICTWALLVAGAMVTSTGSGLAVPDWPTTYGHNMFAYPRAKMVGGILFEHSHRLIASGVGAMTVVLAVWLWIGERRRWLRMLGSAALLMVCAQGLLGALTVKYLLPASVSVLHGCLAQAFFCTVILIAAATSRAWRGDGAATASRPIVRRLCLAATGVVFAQLVLGAIMRHTESGLAVPDFPLAYGRVAPPLDAESVAGYNFARLYDFGLPATSAAQIGWHLAHRAWAAVVLVVVLIAAAVVIRRHGDVAAVCGPAMVVAFAVPMQVGLGALTVWSGRQPYVASLHVAVGAVVLGGVWLMTLGAYRRLRVDPTVREPLPIGSGVTA